MQFDDDFFPLCALGCGTVVLICSIVFVSNRELAIAGTTAAGGLFGVSGTAYQTKVRAQALTKTAPRAPRKPRKATPPVDEL